MTLLSAKNISKYYSSQPVLDGACLEIRRGQRIGLVGPNGAGKTTLLNILIGDLSPDGGDLSLSPGARIGILRQRVDFSEDQTVWQMAQSALQPLLDLAEQAGEIAQQLATVSEAQRSELSRKYDRLHTELQNRGGYQIQFKIRRILEGLGFQPQLDHRPISRLSGGQQNRLMLAKLLLEEPDLMLLDEPSNHLDIAATSWLENFLADSRQAFLLVSHDRYFLDRVTTSTLELVHGQIDAYPGNYTRYKTLKAERLQVERRTYEKQQEEIERLKDFIRRHHHGQKHAQAEDRRRKLARIEREQAAPVPREIPVSRMKFQQPARSGDVVLRVERLAKAFGSDSLFSDLSFQIERGQRWGIVGANGSGKTTLLRCILNQEPVDQGSSRLGVGVELGYFDQHLHCVDNGSISEEAIRPRDESKPEFRLNEFQRRELLAKFGITGDTALQLVGSLSGGQRNRVALANLAAQRANFLILDEPTNHLDLWARESLEKSLREFDGTVLLVSHDRYFLNCVCTHLLILENGAAMVVEGNYDTYRMLVEARQASSAECHKGSEPGQAKNKRSRSQGDSPSKRKRRFPYRKVPDIEVDIAQTESAIEQLHQALTDPLVLRDGVKVVEAKKQLDEKNQLLQRLYEHWEEASELN